MERPSKMPLFAFNPTKTTPEAIKSTIVGLKNKKNGLFELEFPLTNQLNRAGSGSLSDAKKITAAQNSFVESLKSKISLPLLGLGVPCTVHTFTSSTPFPSSSSSDTSILICVAPSQPTHYKFCALAASTRPVIIVNGLFKTPKSIPPTASMLYFLKPLTHNSQISGFLLRSFPSPYTVVDPSGCTLKVYEREEEVLVKGTNTPDLREAVKICSTEADRRAIEQRNRK